MHFETYQVATLEWRWRLKSDDGSVVAESGEGYANKKHALQMIDKILALDEAEIRDVRS